MIKPGDLFEHILTHYRGIFATLFLLPISAVYGAYSTLRAQIAFRRNSAPARHDARVQAVIAQVEAWKQDGCKEKLTTGRSGWKTMSELVPKYKLTHRKIDVGLYDILEIDEARAVVRVEPLASMGQISRSLIAKGWTLAVVPELDDLTVGGLIMGFGVETSSHKYGLFQHICESFEIVTAEGKLLKCGPVENSELYYQIPWSHGTLGFLVAVELRIVRAKPYIRLHYQPVYSLDEMVEVFEQASRDTVNNDFVEGLVYSGGTAVIMRGQFADELGSDGAFNSMGCYMRPWFYKHVQTYLEARRSGVEYLPLRDYFHRHTRSYFWAMEEIIPFAHHPVFRYLLGWALPPRIELLKYTETRTTQRLRERYHVIQDMLVPIRYLKESIRYFDGHFQIYPLWLSPMAIKENPGKQGFIQPLKMADGTVDEMYVDIGAYGTPGIGKAFDSAVALPALEQFVIAHRGYQALYARTCMSREDFRAMFDHTGYDALRERLPYCREAFDDVYDKVSARGRVSPVEMRELERQA
ncbi:FAD-binding oxidoreductase [Methylomagnum ishizawai]|uniref:FAD-binding oxidoreductase n=1 Tax=Methylomagnum ishizawai TaxID=1760988 RepID=UPI001C33000D|nr:FAD-binding protein [Methylomagnum ishizawai]BBL72910.1 hypothetical protein MishRS11D_00080 [Methylomagnum ishizawai]